MSFLYNGGLWTVFLAAIVLFGYIWALNGPKWAYGAVLFLAFGVISGALFLPDAHPFRIRILEGLHWWKWAFAIGLPIAGYALIIRWIKRKVAKRDDP